jgi:hypothetical protein
MCRREVMATMQARKVAIGWTVAVSMAGASTLVGMISACGSSSGSSVPGQPHATEWTLASPAADASRHIERVVTARGVNGQGWAVDPTTRFQVHQAIYVTFLVQDVGLGEVHRVGVRWFLNGALASVAGAHSSQLVTHSGPGYSFSLVFPAPGAAEVRLYWDEPIGDNSEAPNDAFLAQTSAFTVA